jgi:putative membrane protein insertion efficiency factor
MPALRKCLRHPAFYLAVMVLLVLGLTADSLRAPERQFSAGAYVTLVHAYQRFGSPALEGHVRCRYNPTCSRYSVAAVEKYGVRKGLVMTAGRLWRCRRSVPLGTSDPVL